MKNFYKTAKIFTAAFLAVVLLLTGGANIASAGSDHEKARDAVKEYRNIRPDDTNGILLLEEAIDCFWGALELMTARAGHPDKGTVKARRSRCRVAEADVDADAIDTNNDGVLTENPAEKERMARLLLSKGLGDMLGGLTQILIEVLKKP